MDWTSAISGAFLASVLIFAGTALALFAIMRRQFLFWLFLRALALATMAWAFSISLPNLPGITPTERLLAGAIATDLALALCGPMMASYLEQRLPVANERRLLFLALPLSAVPIALLPAVIFADKVDWLHDILLLGLIGLIGVSVVRAASKGSRTALYQGIAWFPLLLTGLAALTHELFVGGMMPFYLPAMLVSLMIEFIVTATGIVAGFMKVRAERDRALAEMKTAKIATATDPLTNIANRRGLDHHFADPARVRPNGIALIDCDHFKRINDQFGHDMGDRVLCSVARALQGAGIFEARLGGEEFVLLLYVQEWQSMAEIARRRITQTVRAEVPELPFPVTASAGLAAVHDDDSLGAAMKRADRALYAAKDAGRNCSLALTEFRQPAANATVTPIDQARRANQIV